ncbi:MAG TPA: VIT domain-containing protein [Nevskiaceae bacterium]|nr:VIT domain-containing protein [Nevskiaceae bacterium]
MSETSIKFCTTRGQPVPLAGMQVNGTLRDAFAVIELTQTYRNVEPTNIEAIYSFPLPLPATLLHLSVRLDDQRLIGHVVERQHAETQYEDAVEAGDSAILLEQAEPGLYTLNVGNLMAGEEAEITLRYALPLTWEGDRLRLALPATVAPRYGDPRKAGLQPHQTPAPDLFAEHRYSLKLNVQGDLAGTDITSPSHAITLTRGKAGTATMIDLVNGEAFADRDFVLVLCSASGITTSATSVRDEAHHESILHLACAIPQCATNHAVMLKLLVDCSGSMAGDSMALAKAGALHVLQQLRPDDRFSVSAFGSTVTHLPGAEQSLIRQGGTPTTAGARRYVRGLHADLGGTEMLPALRAVFALGQRGSDAADGGDVLLITDGEIWERDAVVHACRQSHHRVFVIGVGASPNETVIRDIAAATGGAAVFVAPGEDIRPLAEAHLQRMRVPRIMNARLAAPKEIVWQSPATLSGAAFPGDTLHVFCGMNGTLEGSVNLALDYADGHHADISAHIRPLQAGDALATDLPRIAAAARIRESLFAKPDASHDALTALAVEYQLVTRFTHYLLIHRRGDAAPQSLPELRQVKNMLAAGWGGAASTADGYGVGSRISAHKVLADYELPLDIPAFLREASDDSPRADSSRRRSLFSRAPAGRSNAVHPRDLIKALNPRFSLVRPEKQVGRTLAELYGLIGITMPMDADVTDGLEALVGAGWPEQEVLLAFWRVLLDLLDDCFARAHRRGILRATRQSPPTPELLRWLTATLKGTSGDTWRWRSDSHAPTPTAGLSVSE